MMQKSKVADDPQATNDLQIRLAWLGGVIDADGTILIRRACTKSNNPHKRLRYQPYIGICNADPVFIERCAEILSEGNLPYYITNPYRDKRRISGERNDRRKRRPIVQLQISGYQRCFKALPILLPYIYAKQNQALLLWWWIQYRKEINNFAVGFPKKETLVHHNSYSYGSLDEECYQRLKEMKKVIRSPREHMQGSYGDDVLRTLGRPREAAEMTARQLKLVNK